MYIMLAKLHLPLTQTQIAMPIESKYLKLLTYLAILIRPDITRYDRNTKVLVNQCSLFSVNNGWPVKYAYTYGCH